MSIPSKAVLRSFFDGWVCLVFGGCIFLTTPSSSPVFGDALAGEFRPLGGGNWMMISKSSFRLTREEGDAR